MQWLSVDQTVGNYNMHSLTFCFPTNNQRIMKDVSDSPRLVYFVTRLVNSVLKLPDGQVKFFLGEFFWGNSN